jgi:hypothetical protein
MPLLQMRKLDLRTLEHVGIDNSQEPDTERGYFLEIVPNLEVDMAVVQTEPSVALDSGGQAWPPTSHTRIQQALHSELGCFIKNQTSQHASVEYNLLTC